MLERVSPSAECAAHHILRQLEGPIRSHRYLGLSFWKHGSNELDIPPWWTSYLESLRDRNGLPPTRPRTSHATLANPIAHRFQNARPTQITSRTFSHAHSQAQLAPAQVSIEDDTNTQFERALYAGDSTHTGMRKTTEIDQNEKINTEEHSDTGARLPRRRTRLKLAWDAFVQSGWKEEQASKLLHQYASSDNKSELRYALRAFDFIQKANRTAKDYDVAVNAAIKLSRFSTTIQIMRDAISKELGQETFVKFLALCVSRNLWNTAADLWNEVGSKRNNNLETTTTNTAAGTKNFAGSYIIHFEAIASLPSKLAELLDRLERQDPVFAARRSVLIDLYCNLSQVTLESDKIMSIITPKAVLNILSGQHKLGSRRKLHFDAIATLHRLPDKGTRSRLAMLIYNNFQSFSRTGFVPKWVFGSLLAICSAGKQPSKLYRSLLEDYKGIYGSSDDFMSTQVMKVCAAQGEVGDVFAVFEEYHRDGLCSSEHVNPLIRVYAVVGDHQNAQVQFDRIKSDFKFNPSPKNWNSLLLAYSRSNQPQLTYAKFEEMKQSGTRPDQYSWSIMVATAAKKGDTKHARDLVQQARDAGIARPLAMIGAVIDSCLMNNNPNEAWDLVISGTRASSTTQESPIRLWNSLFRYYAFKSDSEAILRTQERMKELGVKADGMTYAALMTALVIQGRTQDAAQILRTLHFSQTLSANEVHYSILIHGFAMERKTELASIIYREMMERFPRSTPSAKLAMLYVQGVRAEEEARAEYQSGNIHYRPDFRPLLREIDNTIADITDSDLVSAAPNPGFSRRLVRTDLQDAYFGSLVTFLQRNNAHDSAGKIMGLMKQQSGAAGATSPDVNSSWISRLKTMHQEMENYVASRDWQAVSVTWNEIIATAMENCASEATIERTHSERSSRPAKLHNIELIGNEEFRFSSMVPEAYTDPTLSTKSSKILPAHRYVLSRQLSLYIKALDKQSKYMEMIDIVQKLRRYGFALSSKNWNGLIQALCRSSNIDHGVLAYELFQKFLLRNTPSWDVIRRGKWVQPSEENVTLPNWIHKDFSDKRENRKALEKRDPGLLMPSYYTMVHLAIVWLKASRSSSQGDHTTRRRLEERASNTVKLVLKTPYLRDRVQGVLLRGQRVIGDPLKRPRQTNEESNFAVANGNQLLIDGIPRDSLADLQAALQQDDLRITAESLPGADSITGQTHQAGISVPAKNQDEPRLERPEKIVASNEHQIQALELLKQQTQSSLYSSPGPRAALVRDSPMLASNPAVTGSCASANDNDSTTQIQKITRATPRPRIKISSKMTNILRRDRSRPLYPPIAKSSGRQRGSIRTHALTQRYGVSVLPSESCDPSRQTGDLGHQQLQQRTTRYTDTIDVVQRRLRARMISRLKRSARAYMRKAETLESQKRSMQQTSRSASRRIKHYKSKAQRIARILAFYLFKQQPRELRAQRAGSQVAGK